MRRFVLVLCLWLVYPVASAFAERHTLIVLSQDDHAVYDVNPTTGQVLKQVTLEGAPREAIFSWNEMYLFVSVPDAGQVAIVNLRTFKQTGKIENPEFKKPAAGTMGTPLGLASNVEGDKLYIGVEGGLVIYNPKLLVFNPEYKQTPRKIAVTPKDGQYFKVQSMTEKLYYPHRKDNQVVVIDTRNDTVVKSIPVPGGPMDVLFVIGDEAWVQDEDGSITIIDTAKDAVKQTLQTGGKGAGRLSIASDMRYIASTHADSGDVAVIHPFEKKVLATVKTGPGTSSAAFAPNLEGEAFLPHPTKTMYVTTPSEVAVVDVKDASSATITGHQKAGKNLVGNLLHYTYVSGFEAPREGTNQRLAETDLFIARTYRMFLYDISPIHEHRTDMVGVWYFDGVAKNGCWHPECPKDATNQGVGELPYNGVGDVTYNNGYRLTGSVQQQRRGATHQEEGGTPSPPSSVIFELKNNFYRQSQPQKNVMAKAGLSKTYETPRAVGYSVTLMPGDKPLNIPAGGDIAVFYLAGGLNRVIRDGKPDIEHKYFGDWAWEPYAHTIESLTDAMRMVIIELK